MVTGTAYRSFSQGNDLSRIISVSAGLARRDRTMAKVRGVHVMLGT
jgi:hypothetical protein